MGKKNKSQSLMELTPVNNTTLKKKSKDRNMSGLSPAKNLVVTSPQKISPEKKKSKKKSPSPSKKVEKSSMKSPAKGKISTISRDRNTDESDLEDEDTFKPFAQVSKFNLPHDSDTEEEEEEEEQEDGLEAIEGFDTPNKKVAGSDKVEGNWLKEDVKKLLKILAEDQESTCEISFRVSVAKLNFEDLSKKMDRKFTSNQIKTKISSVFSSVNSLKNLSQMVDSCLFGLDKILKVNSRGGVVSSKVKKISTSAPYEYYIKKHPAVNPKEAKTKYDSLAHGKKLKYITKSIKEYKSAHRESEEVTCKIRKNEFEIYFSSEGMPALPPKKALHLYLKDYPMASTTDETGANMLAVYNQFAKGPHFTEYNNKFTKMVKSFLVEFDRWIPELPECLKPHAAIIKSEVEKYNNTNKKSVKETKGKRKIEMMIDELKVNSIKKNYVMMFPNEPKKKLFTPYEVHKGLMAFCERNNMPTVEYSATDSNDRQSLEKMAIKNKEDYKQEIKDFVDILTPEEQKIYIGQNRIRLLKLYQGVDIFNEDFPSSEFPSFITPSRVELDETQRKKEEENRSKMVEDLKEMSSVGELPDSMQGFPKKVRFTSTPMVSGKLNEEEDEDEDDSTSTEEEQANGPVDIAVKKTAGADSGMDDSSSSSENESRVVTKKIHTKKLLVDKSSSTSGSDSSEEQPSFAKKRNISKDAASPSPKKRKINKSMSQSHHTLVESSDDEGSSSEEEALTAYA